MAKTKMWRPTDKTPETVQKLVAAFQNDFTVEEACTSARIAISTFYLWMQQDEDFMEEIEAAKKFCRFKAKRTIQKNLDDPAMARWYAERKMKDQWYSGRVEMTDWAGNPITVKAILSDIWNTNGWEGEIEATPPQQTMENNIGEDIQNQDEGVNDSTLPTEYTPAGILSGENALQEDSSTEG